jgi:hypothetical protein
MKRVLVIFGAVALVTGLFYAGAYSADKPQPTKEQKCAAYVDANQNGVCDLCEQGKCAECCKDGAGCKQGCQGIAKCKTEGQGCGAVKTGGCGANKAKGGCPFRNK